MDITILTKSNKPIYEQIYEQISAQILNGNLTADECLPSIRSIAKELSIGIITVKKAYELLEESGFIYTLPGKGCFVKNHSNNNLNSKRFQLAEEKLKSEISYYQGLGLSAEEICAIIKKLYDNSFLDKH